MSETTSNSEKTIPGGGPEVDIALFSRVQQLINSVRLIQNGRITVDTVGIASDVHVAKKEFEMGHFDRSFAAVNRLANSFDQKVGQWESAARRKELHKQKLSMEQLRKMHAEHSGVRTRVQLVKAQLRRLRVGLDHLEKQQESQLRTSEGSAPEESQSEEPAVQEPSAETAEPSKPSDQETARDQPQLPAGFLEAFQASREPRRRSEVVKQYFGLEAELSVKVKRKEGRNLAYFAPFELPPMNRFYFLAETAQIILARDLKTAKVMRVHYPESGESEMMPLKDFVKQVRKGVWLLRPKPADE